jgi:uncharacterized glyoxalase superfamily protein PhnB
MTSLSHVTLESPDPAAAEAFYAAAFGLDERLRVRASDEPTSGFRGYTLSLVVAQPSTVDSLTRSALEHGATELKPAQKSFWGYGSALQAPDGSIWTIATSSKKEVAPANRDVDEVVLLLGVADVKASKRFYADRGLTVGKSFGGKYVEFDLPDSPVKLSLYPRKAAAKNAGVSPEGSGSRRLAIGSDAGAFTDPDGFAWE